MQIKKTAKGSKNRRTDRPDYLKIPFISMGILLGAVAIPPLTETASAGKGTKRIVKGFVRIGSSKKTFMIPAFITNKVLKAGANRAQKRVAAFSKEKKAVHHFVIKTMPQIQKPLSLDFIAKELDLPLEKVSTLVDELEGEKTFLYREDSSEINWAYPVTTRNTPHRVTFSSGEQINAAWAIDAIAMPFVQGQLRKEYLSFKIETSCAHTGRPMSIEIDSNLKVQQIEKGANPYIFVPSIDSVMMKEPSIVDLFWRRSVFFWSEENVKAHRKQNGGPKGAYFTLKQSLALTAPMQGALFGF